jgi:predicted small metal-binding protein
MWGVSERSFQMLRQVRCEWDYYVARGLSDDEVIAIILDHLAKEHPDIADAQTADDIRSWIELVPE